jgi:LDH2 family malate/lactate/ureidoglycolate dehydrogenase
MEAARRFPATQLHDYCRVALQARGVAAGDAGVVADCLIAANLNGVDTHGVARLPIYLRRLAQGAINSKAQPSFVARHGATAVLDGDNGLGPVVARLGMTEAIARAREHGVSYVTARRSNHFSYAAWYCEQAAAEGLMGLCSSGGEPTVAPWGGKKAFFTNSPLAFAAPTRHEPLVVDLATSVSSRGNILLADMLGQSIPADWAIDAEGRATTNAAAALKGCVLPMGGAKGYALIVALEILNSMLAGGATAPNVGSQAAQDGAAAGVSHFFIAIDPIAMMEKEIYLDRMDALLNATKVAPSADSALPIRLPGERRRDVARERRDHGIPIPSKIVDELRAAAEKFAPDAKEYLS